MLFFSRSKHGFGRGILRFRLGLQRLTADSHTESQLLDESFEFEKVSFVRTSNTGMEVGGDALIHGRLVGGSHCRCLDVLCCVAAACSKKRKEKEGKS